MKGVPQGKNAKHVASAPVFGKVVTLQIYGKDKYGRTLADVCLPDRTNDNHMLVGEGWCWWYRKYTLLNTKLEGLKQTTREVERGLWVDPHPVPLWEWGIVRPTVSVRHVH